MVFDKSQTQDLDNPGKPSVYTTGVDEVSVNLVEEKGGKCPVPRRDHSAIMIRNNEYMLIYGGKNDSAFQYKAPDLLQNSDNQAQ